MSQYNREETITLVSKNPSMVALFLHRAMGEGFVAFQEGTISPVDLTLALLAVEQVVGLFLRGKAHEVVPYRQFVAEMIDRGDIEVTGELGRISDPATPQSRPTVN